MKKASLLLLIFISLTAFTCENEGLDPDIEIQTTNPVDPNNPGDPNNPNNPTTGTFQVDINGETYVADMAGAAYINDVVNITAFRNNNEETITITFKANQTGIYELGVANPGEFFVNGAGYVPEAGANGFVSALEGNMIPQGEINLLEIDEVNQTLSGTFSFTAYREETAGNVEVLEFTNGNFANITYSGDFGDIDNPSNSFFAKVDGVEFVEDAVNGVEVLGAFNTIGITAIKNSFETIGLTVPNDITPGEYTFGDPGDGTPVGQYNVSQTETFIAEGTLIITVHNTESNRIEGTFSFTARPFLGDPNPTYDITEGTFGVSY
ncbi:DUF6252 family protein [uncultured Kordia sp.]|uniref:DUF6252 family protein n=1 Tax=uncultured Kordia sp. TaxID=507699 RepID=UPI0026359F80|nr:DUF6252 family protein [uncultured Kordia sp.]